MPRAETASYKFNHTMLRIRDPTKSLHFYREILGMDLVDKKVYETFTLYFLAFPSGNQVTNAVTRFAREGVLELTHNHGTETDANFKGYANGNTEPRGFGHIALAVDDVNKASERLERLGVKFQKKPSDGSMKDIAFILDPDNYWIELVNGYYGPIPTID